MTRLLTCGFETSDINEAGSNPVLGTNGTATVVSSVPTPRGGTYCAKFTATQQSSGTSSKAFLFPSKTEIWIRVAVFFHGWVTSEQIFAKLTDSGGVDASCMSFSGSDNLLRVRQGGGTGNTLLATASAAALQDGWRVIEWHHQMTSLTSGTTEVWLDGTRVINFTGDNTAGTTLNVATLTVGQLNAVTATGQYTAYDDLALNDSTGTVNNTRVGDGRVVLLTPTGAGSNTALSRGGTDTGANYSQTNELPPSMTQYVFSATAASRDTYALSDLPSGVASINAAEVLVLAQNSDAGAGSLGLTVKSGSTTNEGSAQALGTTAAYIRQLYETDPATSAAWTTTAMNALEAGVTVR